jgi:isocitrate lyase
MFQLDDKFLQELGLDQLPENEKQAFKDHIYSRLEIEVGTRLSDGLSEAQLSEFESFVDRDDEKVMAWIANNVPDYQTDPSYQQLVASVPQGVDQAAVMAEYASLKWLSLNRPDYRQVVAAVLEELKREIIGNRDAILGAAS